MGTWSQMRSLDFIEFNPRLSIKKGAVATKVAMDKLKPFTKKIPETEKAEFGGGSKFCNGDTIMARITPCLENGKTAFIDILEDNEIAFGSTEFIVMRARDGVSDPQFVYYLATSPMFRSIAIKSMVGSSGRQRVQQSVLNELNLNVPSLEEQKRIGSFLAWLDEKIAINNQINDNLAQQAQAVFVDMFAKNKAVVPATIADIALNVTDGVHNTVHDDPEGEFFLLSCKNIKGGTLSIGPSERRISSDTFEKLRRRTKLSKGDVLISSVGTVGELLLLNEEPFNYEFQRSVAMVKPNLDIVSPAYLYESLLSQKAELINAAHGAVQQCLFISDIAGFPIGIPERDELYDFDTAVTPLFDMISANEAENQRLAEMRDALLPKLMSGELDVSNLML